MLYEVITFLESATVGGVVSSGAQWEKGYFSVTDEGFWFLSARNQKRIPIENLGSVKTDLRNVGGKHRITSYNVCYTKLLRR